MNAATDNPLVCSRSDEIVSNGNFHGQPVAFALDCARDRRRRARRASPSAASSAWSTRACRTACPPFLTRDGGLNSGFMIPQYVPAALVSENKVLAHPASVDSIPTSAGQEDHVSMGNAAGLKALQVLANVERALAIELLAGAQAVEFLAPLGAGPRGRCGPRSRPHPVGAAARGPLALGRHRTGCSLDPGRQRDRCRRGRVRGDPLMARDRDGRRDDRPRPRPPVP